MCCPSSQSRDCAFLCYSAYINICIYIHIHIKNMQQTNQRRNPWGAFHRVLCPRPVTDATSHDKHNNATSDDNQITSNNDDATSDYDFAANSSTNHSTYNNFAADDKSSVNYCHQSRAKYVSIQIEDKCKYLHIYMYICTVKKFLLRMFGPELIRIN